MPLTEGHMITLSTAQTITRQPMTLHERHVWLQKNGSAQNCNIWPPFICLFMRPSYLELSYVHTI